MRIGAHTKTRNRVNGCRPRTNTATLWRGRTQQRYSIFSRPFVSVQWTTSSVHTLVDGGARHFFPEIIAILNRTPTRYDNRGYSWVSGSHRVVTRSRLRRRWCRYCYGFCRTEDINFGRTIWCGASVAYDLFDWFWFAFRFSLHSLTVIWNIMIKCLDCVRYWVLTISEVLGTRIVIIRLTVSAILPCLNGKKIIYLIEARY